MRNTVVIVTIKQNTISQDNGNNFLRKLLYFSQTRAKPGAALQTWTNGQMDYVIVIKNFLNLEGHPNLIIGSEITVILLKGWIWPIVGVVSGRVSRLVDVSF